MFDSKLGRNMKKLLNYFDYGTFKVNKFTLIIIGLQNNEHVKNYYCLGLLTYKG